MLPEPPGALATRCAAAILTRGAYMHIPQFQCSVCGLKSEERLGGPPWAPLAECTVAAISDAAVAELALRDSTNATRTVLLLLAEGDAGIRHGRLSAVPLLHADDVLRASESVRRALASGNPAVDTPLGNRNPSRAECSSCLQTARTAACGGRWRFAAA